MKAWVKELNQLGPKNIIIAIAGNKCDRAVEREVFHIYSDSIFNCRIRRIHPQSFTGCKVFSMKSISKVVEKATVALAS